MKDNWSNDLNIFISNNICYSLLTDFPGNPWTCKVKSKIFACVHLSWCLHICKVFVGMCVESPTFINTNVHGHSMNVGVYGCMCLLIVPVWCRCMSVGASKCVMYLLVCVCWNTNTHKHQHALMNTHIYLCVHQCMSVFMCIRVCVRVFINRLSVMLLRCNTHQCSRWDVWLNGS